MTLKNSNFLKRNAFSILAVFASVGLIALPILLMGLSHADDLRFHMERIESLALEFKANNLFPRIYSTALNDFGYASPMFYGDLFLRIPAFLVAAGMSVADAYQIFVAVIAVSGAIISCCCFKAIAGDSNAAGIGTFLYILSSYFATDIFIRAAIGEALVFVFLPIAFLGYYSIMFDNAKKWFLLPLGLFFMLQSHILLTVAFVIILTIFTVVNIGTIIKTPKKLLYIAISALLFFGISAYFLFPMIDQLMSTSFLASDGTSTLTHGTLAERAIPWWGLVSDFNIRVDSISWVPNGVGLAFIAAWVLYFIMRKKAKLNMALIMLTASTVLLLVTSNLFPWDFFQDIFSILQFPWRLLIFVVFFMALGSVFLVKKLERKNKIIISSIFIILTLFSFVVTVGGRYKGLVYFLTDNSSNVDTYREYNNNIGMGEYLPSGTDKDEILNSPQTVSVNNSDMITSLSRSHGKVEVEFSNNNAADSYIDLPLIMYKGYSAVTPNGEQLPLTYGENNRIRVIIDDMQQGSFIVQYTGTTTQHISDIISIVSIIIFAGFIIIKIIKHKKCKNTITSCMNT